MYKKKKCFQTERQKEQEAKTALKMSPFLIPEKALTTERAAAIHKDGKHWRLREDTNTFGKAPLVTVDVTETKSPEHLKKGRKTDMDMIQT